MKGAMDALPSALAAAPTVATRPSVCKPIRLLKFVTVFGFGGTERQFVTLGLALDPSRFDLRFGCLRRWGHFLPDIEARQIPVREYPVRSFRDPRVLVAQLKLARDIRRERIQIVHTYNFYSNAFAIAPAKLAGARIVASIRDMGPYLSPAQRRLQRWACRAADRIAVNASAIREWLVADGYDSRKIVVIPNGLPPNCFGGASATASLRAELRLSPDAPLVGMVSRVTRVKGIEDFLEAAGRVSASFPAARFLIVGEGFTTKGRTVISDTPYQRELAEVAARCGIRDRVIFTGFRADVAEILPQLQVSVLPSLSEGLSNTLLESMAAGVPVVATRVGGTPEVVENGRTGLLVPPRDPAALADAIGRLLACPVLAGRLAEAARRDVADRFSVSRLVDTTSRLYDSLVNHRTG